MKPRGSEPASGPAGNDGPWTNGGAVRQVAAILAALFLAMSPATAGAPTVSPAAGPNPDTDWVAATPALIRQAQFMLSSIGIDPGPIDGIPRQLTNAAVHKFEEQAGLPAADLVSNGQISTALLGRLRQAASAVLLGSHPPPGGAPAAAASPPPAPPHPPPPDRFAACAYDRADFLIGGTQYTPDSFLQTGFAGSTARAVASLTDRLTEARQVAQEIGGPALKEVQRQARVLAYFECRLKIEQASAGSN